jgi:hypothetical protein
VAELLIAVAGLAISIWGLFSRTDYLLTQIRDVLVDIRNQGVRREPPTPPHPPHQS